VLGEEPDRHYVLFVSVTAPDGSADSRLEAVELQLNREDGVGYVEAGRMAEALVTTSRVVTQERHQVNWGATGFDTLTTVVSYLTTVAAGLTVEGTKVVIERWPKRNSADVIATQTREGGTEIRESVLQLLRRAFREEAFDEVYCQSDGQGGWDFVATAGRVRYEGRVHPGGLIRTASRRVLPSEADLQKRMYARRSGPRGLA